MDTTKSEGMSDAQVRKIAVKIDAAPAAVRKVLDGRRVSMIDGLRIKTALRRLGIAFPIAMLLLAGCYPDLPGEVYEMDGQAEAAKFIWNDQYGMTGTPPETHWMTGSSLNCAGGYGFLIDGNCKGGVSTPAGSSLAWAPGMLMSDTAMAHEYAHVRAFDRGQDGEAHPVAVFGRLNADGDYTDPDCEVGRVNAALVAAGM